MISELFRIGSYSQSPFGLLMVAAFAVAFFQLRSNLRGLKIGDDDDAHVMIFWAAVAGILGGKVYFALLNGDLSLIFERFGFVWYGGLFLGTLAVVLVVRRRKLPFGSTADAAAPALALGYGVGRVGCFLVGDDYGVPTEAPWAVAFPVGLPPTTAGQLRETFGIEVPAEIPADRLLEVHPTQVYETLAALVIWAVGMWSLKRGGGTGRTALLVFGLLATERFLVEFVRAKDDRFLAGFTIAQFWSVLLVAIVLALALRLRRRSRAGRAAAG